MSLKLSLKEKMFYSGFDFAFLEVKTCSKAVFASAVGYGESPCFLQVAFLNGVSPDYSLLKLPCVDGVNFLECAFCYGSKW